MITGASGFVGSVLCRRLVEQKQNVHVILRKEAKTWRIDDLLSKIHIHKSDLTNPTELNNIISKVKPDVIYHLATYGGYSYQADADQIMQTNIMGTWNLLKACNRIPYRLFVNTGSSSEYGYKKFAMRETDVLEPASYYAVTKCTQSQLCSHIARQENRPIVTLRLFSAYGPFEEPTRFVPTLLRSLLHQKKMNLVAPEIARDYIYIDDIVDAYLKISELIKFPGEKFNIGTGVQSTIKEVVELAQRITKQTTMFEWGGMNNRKWDTNNWVGDVSKARSMLDWIPKTSLDRGIELTAKWIGDNEKRYRNYA